MKCPKCGYIAKKRSASQNNTYWKFIIEPFADELGYTSDEMHFALKTRFLATPDEKTGLMRLDSSADQGTVMFNKYMEDCIRLAATMGIQLTLPDDD